MIRRTTVLLVLAATMVAIPGHASAAACSTWSPPPQPRNVGTDTNVLNAVAPTAGCSLWAAGSWTGDGRLYNALIQRWNGTAWRVIDSPQPGDWARLTDITATSATNAWAVGAVNDGSVLKTLILRWNGSTWARQPSPSPGSTDSRLESITATSATNAWAVGSMSDGMDYTTLILHWDGASWKRQKSPNRASPTNQLYGVDAVSASTAWAVGFTNGGPPLVLRFSGGRWKLQATPTFTGSAMTGIAAASASTAWAVGSRFVAGNYETVVLRWNGTAWKRVASPSPSASLNTLEDVAVARDGTAWAVGRTTDATEIRSLVVRWNGSSWTREPSFEFIDDAESRLSDVAVISPTNVWAVGSHDSPIQRTFAVHCC